MSYPIDEVAENISRTYASRYTVMETSPRKVSGTVSG
jgi:hypothetical protein